MIDDYFRTISAIVSASPIVQFTNVTFDKRSVYVGYLRGDIIFANGSRLHFREFVNTDHFPDLPNSPHHKHIGDEPNVIPVTPPDLAMVLKEIESLIELD